MYGEAITSAQLDHALDCVRATPTPKAVVLMLPKCGTRHVADIFRMAYERPRDWCSLHPRPWISNGERDRLTVKDCPPEEPQGGPGLSPAAEHHQKFRELEREVDLRGVPMLTVLRDPVEYMLSFYSFVEWNWTQRDWKEELRAWASVSPLNDNTMLGILAGRRHAALFTPGHDLECSDVAAIGEVSDSDLAHVIGRIREGRLLVTTLERFEAGIRRFAKHLGWQRFDPDKYEHGFGPRSMAEFDVNTTNRIGDFTRHRILRSEVPADVLQLLRARSRLDRQLYKWVREREVQGFAPEALLPSQEL